MGIAVIGLLLTMTSLGLAMAVVAFTICGLTALITGRGFARYALAGAVFGLFISPAIHVLARAFGVRLPPAVVVVTYALSYAGWLVAIGSLSAGLYFIWYYTLGLFSGQIAPEANVASALFVSTPHLAAIAGSGFAAYYTARGLVRKYRAERGNRLMDPLAIPTCCQRPTAT